MSFLKVHFVSGAEGTINTDNVTHLEECPEKEKTLDINENIYKKEENGESRLMTMDEKIALQKKLQTLNTLVNLTNGNVLLVQETQEQIREMTNETSMPKPKLV